MKDYHVESAKLQHIDLLLKFFAVGDCIEKEKRMTIEWVSELTDELMARL